jgi:hypothetical protein
MSELPIATRLLEGRPHNDIPTDLYQDIGTAADLIEKLTEALIEARAFLDERDTLHSDVIMQADATLELAKKA